MVFPFLHYLLYSSGERALVAGGSSGQRPPAVQPLRPGRSSPHRPAADFSSMCPCSLVEARLPSTVLMAAPTPPAPFSWASDAHNDGDDKDDEEELAPKKPPAATKFVGEDNPLSTVAAPPTVPCPPEGLLSDPAVC
jgi:hypothetical protein